MRENRAGGGGGDHGDKLNIIITTCESRMHFQRASNLNLKVFRQLRCRGLRHCAWHCVCASVGVPPSASVRDTSDTTTTSFLYYYPQASSFSLQALRRYYYLPYLVPLAVARSVDFTVQAQQIQTRLRLTL